MTSFLKKILSCARCDAVQAVYKKGKCKFHLLIPHEGVRGVEI